MPRASTREADEFVGLSGMASVRFCLDHCSGRTLSDWQVAERGSATCHESCLRAGRSIRRDIVGRVIISDRLVLGKTHVLGQQIISNVPVVGWRYSQRFGSLCAKECEIDIELFAVRVFVTGDEHLGDGLRGGIRVLARRVPA